MAHAHAPSPAPTWPLAGLAALALLALVAVGWQRWVAPPAPVPLATTWERHLRFEDRPDASVAVLDADSGAEVARFQGEQGFLRGTLRALARQRARQGIGPQPAFVLAAHDGGRLVLADPATGERIHLESFGPTNLAVFAQLRPATTAPRTP